MPLVPRLILIRLNLIIALTFLWTAALHAAPPAKGGTGSRPAAASARLDPPRDELFQQDVAWSPDGQWLAFSEYSGGATFAPDKWAVYVVKPDGTGKKRVLEHARSVSWHPDGKRLAVGFQETDVNEEIYSVDLNGGSRKRLTDHPGLDTFPAWSPQGDKIAFVSDHNRLRAVYLINADGSGLKRLTKSPFMEFQPAWSPDGKKVVIHRDPADGKTQIYAVPIDGSAEQTVSADDATNVYPSYLPSGDIGFVQQTPDGKGPIFRVRADGSGRTRVGSVDALFARWSPDGKRVAFIAGAWPKSAIYVMNADGGGVRKVVN
jgi:TolB protein